MTEEGKNSRRYTRTCWIKFCKRHCLEAGEEVNEAIQYLLSNFTDLFDGRYFVFSFFFRMMTNESMQTFLNLQRAVSVGS